MAVTTHIELSAERLTADLGEARLIAGPPGADGNGIRSALLNEDYTLTLNFTDGGSYTTPPIRGAEGNGISGAVLNGDYTLTVSFTDGGSYTTPPIRGEKGDAFEYSDFTAEQLAALKGEPGSTGNGISGAVLNADYTLTLSFTDGTEYTTPPIRGESGTAPYLGEDGTWYEWDGEKFTSTGTKASELKDENSGENVRLWFGTTEEYNALEVIESGVLYHILEGPVTA